MTARPFVDGGRRPRRRALAASAVCAGHVLVLLALLELRQAPPRDASEARRLTTIRLLPERRERAAPTAAAVAPQPVRASVRPQPVAEPVLPAEAAQVASLPVPATVAAAASGVAMGAEPGGQAGTSGAAGNGHAPLSLKPSRDVLLGSLGSNEAVHDPRSNTPKPTFEERIAMALNPELCVKVERLPDGTIKRSMGKWRGVLSTAQATGVTSGGGSGGGNVGGAPGAGGLSFGGGGGGGIKLCT